MDKVKRSLTGCLFPPRYCALLLALCLSTLILTSNGEDSAQDQDDNGYPSNNLAVALEEMLGYNQDKGLSLQKKASQVPRCDVGGRCAIKHGPRIGKLCDCLRGTSCNSFLLRCY